ncbi:GNAT family N-acetyltransferase [Reinekea sp. G2M2-21]|uniref:GNAT family N-acetyltransferase n=1 Tax=Reinekea sp. G2M2-21 TaxID=2788942 RepID=UPI0018A8C655|nr:GNAT family N-acetyltransferase [Reinekea sp. G2M2-21]
MAIVCRTAKAEDLDDINVLFQSVQRGAVAFSRRQEIVFQRLLDEALVDLLVVEQDEFVVACCHCAIIPTLGFDGRPYAMLNHLIVDPLNRRQGLATRLLSYASEYAKKSGCYQIYLAADATQDWQQAFVRKSGFVVDQSIFVYR